LQEECHSAVEALKILENQNIDLLFVDINMPDLNGLEFVKSLDKKPLVIFTTAHSEYAIEGFKVEATDYLLKPFSFAEFSKATTRAKKQLELIKTPRKKWKAPTIFCSSNRNIKWYAST